MVGRRVLVPEVEVRSLAPQPHSARPEVDLSPGELALGIASVDQGARMNEQRGWELRLTSRAPAPGGRRELGGRVDRIAAQELHADVGGVALAGTAPAASAGSTG